jgi:cytochrome c553
MNKQHLALFIAGCALATGAVAQSAGDPAAGKAKSYTCTGCHGIDGARATFPDVFLVPKLGGQHAAYIVAALKAYKSGDRFNGTMRAQASALSEKDMADIGAYYESAATKFAEKK